VGERGGADAEAALTDRLLTADDVAEILSVPKSWVYAETRAGRLPYVKLGRYYRYAEESIEAFVAGLERGPVPYRRYSPRRLDSSTHENAPAALERPGADTGK
jgi:excisionase family DNA binding protein